MLGLLGTVIGLMVAFQSLEGTTGPVEPGVVAGGLWQAMITTVIGLIIAVPCLVCHAWFRSRIRYRMADAAALLTALSLAADMQDARSCVGSSEMQDEAGGQPNLTPLIDVVFMLIVFLLLTANAAQFVVTVDLPQASSATPSESQPLLLQPPMEERGSWVLDGQTFENADLLCPVLKKAVAENQERVLVIAIDASASSQRLIDAMDVATEAGATAVEISTKSQGE